MTELKLCWEYLASAVRARRCKCRVPPARESASGNRTGCTPVVWARAASCGGLRWLLSASLLVFGGGSMRGERFGDISVTVSGMHQGKTFHGYYEYRVTVENHSPKHTHRVRLVYPERSWSYGNSIDRLTRTVVVPPGAQLVVPLWQPPLEIHGNQNLQVEVDGRVAGRVSVPVAGQHAPERRGYSSDPPPGAVLVSRGLDMAAAERVLIPERIELGAAAATGPPDAGRFKAPHLVWTPDPFAPEPHWIELDYMPPVTADTLRIYHGLTAMTATGTVALIGVSGSNILTLPFGGPASTNLQRYGQTGWVHELRFEPTREPVRTVRIEFSEICSIDAVGLSGPGGTAWAKDARCSSAAKTGGTSAGAGSSSVRACLRAELPVTAWSEHWLAYSPYDAVLVTASELRSAPPGVVSALWQYAEAGGNLFVVGPIEPPAPWQTRRPIPGANAVEYQVGFGRCVVLNSGRLPERHDTAEGVVLRERILSLAEAWASVPVGYSADRAFRVVKSAGVPVRAFVMFMLGFVLLVGPVNLWVLSRLRRRTWMLWTIPVISLLASVCVLAWSLLSEGVTPSVRMESVVILDQVNRRATSLGAVAYYCPVAPRGGLKFGYDTELTPLGGEPSGAVRREVDWTTCQHLVGEWVSARLPMHFLVRRSEPRRERIQVEWVDDRPAVINGLGAQVQTLWFADGSGRIYRSGLIAPGAKAVLEPAELGTNAPATAEIGDVFRSVQYGGYAAVVANNPVAYLRPGTYVAELDRNPFLESGLTPGSAVKWVTNRCVVVGILGAEAGGGPRLSEVQPRSR